MNLKKEICNAFNQHARAYEKAAIVQQEIGCRLFERLSYLNIKPRYILDLGCGSGVFSKQLKQRYPEALVVGFDLAVMMLRQAEAKQSLFKKWSLVCGDMATLPFASGIFDLVFANQTIHWAGSLEEGAMARLMGELNRVMNVGGCLMFSTLGLDTFCELRESWSKVHSYAHINTFVDMHDLGDVMLAEHFIDPVVDMEMLSLHYPTLSKLLHALKAQGVRNINPERNKGLTGRQSFRDFEVAMAKFRTESGQFPLTYEVVYGHAWKGTMRRMAEGTESFIPVSQLRRS